MNVAIERAVCRAHEASHKHRTTGGDECRDGVGGSIQRGQSHLRIRMRFLGGRQSRAAAPGRRLRMAHGASVAVERWPQTFSFFNGSRDRDRLGEPQKCMAEQGQFVGVEGEIRAASSGSTRPWTWFLLSPRPDRSHRKAEKAKLRWLRWIASFHVSLLPTGTSQRVASQPSRESFLYANRQSLTTV